MTRNLDALLLKVGVDNFLVIATNPSTAEELEQFKVPCYRWKGTEKTFSPLNSTIPDAWHLVEQMNEASWIGVGAFPVLTKLRHFFTAEILKHGYNVLSVDSDLVFLRNPYEYFQPEMNKYHLWFQQDDYNEIWVSKNISFLAPNAGFFFVKSSEVGIKYYERLCYRLRHDMIKNSDQQVVWAILSEEGFLERGDVHLLPTDLFPVLPVWKRETKAGRYSDELPYVVHFNWILGKANKIHALRENLFWVVEPESYFEGKYIMMPENQIGWNSVEGVTLFVLGKLLNRIPLLPNGAVPNYIGIDLINKEKIDFRARSFYDDARFLRHKSKEAATLYVDFKESAEPGVESHNNHLKLHIPEHSCGVSAEKIIEYLGSPTAEQYPMLLLKNANKLFSGFPHDSVEFKEWTAILKRMFKHTIFNEWHTDKNRACWWWGNNLIDKWDE
eukprot:TRINITY_DN2309_c0_g1_i1.p1 TRINITY_DN2309_c0_g1~~TRINITY_DN2309_c0_g1_i1.p1  ORF type:complete len:521 (+),score=111.30 TRINITY_DN2309_c0_g1_i1:236-1564(+)